MQKLHVVLKDYITSTILINDVAWCHHKPTKQSSIIYIMGSLCTKNLYIIVCSQNKRSMALEVQCKTWVGDHKNRIYLPENYRSSEIVKLSAGLSIISPYHYGFHYAHVLYNLQSQHLITWTLQLNYYQYITRTSIDDS